MAQLIPKLYLATKQNVLGEEITDVVRKGSVSYDPDRTIKMALKLDLNRHDAIEVYADYLAPVLTVVYDDGSEVTSQMGLYAPVPPKETITRQQRVVTIEGRDLTWLVSADVFDAGYTVAAGTNVVEAVKSILAGMGLTRTAITPSDRTATSALSWKPGTTKLEVVNDLLNGSGYYTLSALKDGTLASTPYSSVKDASVAVTYDTTDRQARVKVFRSITLDATENHIVNKVVVVKDNASEDPIVVTKTNDNPLSPTSTVNRDVTIAKVVRDATILDEAAAEAIATRVLEEASMAYRRLSLTTSPDLERGPNETYRLNIVDPHGAVVADGLWRCRGWSCGFTPADGLMTHELSNVDNPPFAA